MSTRRRTLLCWPALALLSGCAALTGHDPVQVAVAGLEPLPGEGLELRFLIKLRVQNPNDTPIDYDGVFVELESRGDTLASGVSDARGTVPRFGETVLAVPITVSTVRVLGQAISRAMGPKSGPIDYVLRGKIAGPGFAAARFESRGQLSLPGQ